MSDQQTPTGEEAPRSPQPPRRRRPRSHAITLVVALVAAVIAVALVAGNVTAPVGRVSVSPTPTEPTDDDGSVSDGGYLTTIDEIERRARRAAAGREPHASSVTDLLEWAEEAREVEPDPAEPLRIDGTEGPFVDDSAAAYGFALAYRVTGAEGWAREAIDRIDAWVETTRTTERTCPDDGDCQTSLIIGRAAPGFVFAADLLEGSADWTPDRADALRSWLREVILPTASVLPNNWGDAGTFMRVVVADYLGDRGEFEAAIDTWREMMDMVADDGHIPLEVERGRSGMGYTQEALDYKVAVAEIASRRGIDLWSYEGRGGGTLMEAIDYLARYWAAPDEWPWHDRVRVPPTGPLWEIAYARSPKEAYEPIIADRRPYTFQGHSAVRFTTLTHGIPFEDDGVGVQSRDAWTNAPTTMTAETTTIIAGTQTASAPSGTRSSWAASATLAPRSPVPTMARIRSQVEAPEGRRTTTNDARMAVTTTVRTTNQPPTTSA